MSWYDEDLYHEWKKVQDGAKDEVESTIFEFCEKNFYRYEPINVINQGDVLIYYLRYRGDAVNNFGMEDLQLYYNTWYPGEFNVSRMEPVYRRDNSWRDTNDKPFYPHKN